MPVLREVSITDELCYTWNKTADSFPSQEIMPFKPLTETFWDGELSLYMFLRRLFCVHITPLAFNLSIQNFIPSYETSNGLWSASADDGAQPSLPSTAASQSPRPARPRICNISTSKLGGQKRTNAYHNLETRSSEEE